jgi:hypothetical protein
MDETSFLMTKLIVHFNILHCFGRRRNKKKESNSFIFGSIHEGSTNLFLLFFFFLFFFFLFLFFFFRSPHEATPVDDVDLLPKPKLPSL